MADGILLAASKDVDELKLKGTLTQSEKKKKMAKKKAKQIT